MKRLVTFLAATLLAVCSSMAVPAYRHAVTVEQPDGSLITIRVHGDEYLHFQTTDDGYSLVRNDRGYLVYAQLTDGQLTPTSYVAHDADRRTADEQLFLAGVQKYLAPQPAAVRQQEQQAEQARRRQAQRRRADGESDYEGFRGLIILVEFTDRSFSRDDYADIMTDMANAENYAGYGSVGPERCTGSVRDYYSDNSGGLFTPQFDVVGPVKVARSQYYVNSTSNAQQLMQESLAAADSLVDYSVYDADGDGEVDMVYFIFAGFGSNYGNDARLLWPHASYIYGWPRAFIKDGVRFGRYACSVELYGTPRSNVIDGIGTICHEFGHVLGLPDLYDTNYEQNGQSNHPATWSIMAGGSYENYGRTPVGYTLYERYTLGFTMPETITEVGSYELDRLDLANKGYRIDSPVRNEFFLLENRQQSFKWDAYLPGHGMLVFRVDSTSVRPWAENTVNANASHNYFELLRAGNAATAAASDPFPGTRRVTLLNASTTPALKSWRGNPVTLGLIDIKETDGVITFDVEDATVLRQLSLPAAATVPLGIPRSLDVEATPYYALYELSWSSSDESVAVIEGDGRVRGVSEGTCVITATSDNGLTAECTLTVQAIDVADDLAAFKALEPETGMMVRLTDAQVLYVHGKDIYVRDASGALIIRNNASLTMKARDVLNGYVYGVRETDKSLPVLSTVDGLTLQSDFTAEDGSAIVPRRVSLSELTEADYCDYVVIDTVRLVKGTSGTYATDGHIQLRVRNTLSAENIKVPSNYETKWFDVTAIYGTNTVGGELINELYLMKSPAEVPAPSAIVQPRVTPSADGRRAYDLQGLPVVGTTQGIVIRDGRKYVQGK